MRKSGQSGCQGQRKLANEPARAKAISASSSVHNGTGASGLLLPPVGPTRHSSLVSVIATGAVDDEADDEDEETVEVVAAETVGVEAEVLVELVVVVVVVVLVAAEVAVVVRVVGVMGGSGAME